MLGRTGISQDEGDRIPTDSERQAEKRRILAEAKRKLRERLGEPVLPSGNGSAAGRSDSQGEVEEK